MKDLDSIFEITDADEFSQAALAVFAYQYKNNLVYREYCDRLRKSPKNVKQVSTIPFLPIQFFKSREIQTGSGQSAIVFTSSGTTGSIVSKHVVLDLELYKKSFTRGFEQFYGNPADYCILALLPSYLERQNSSLIYMVDTLIKWSQHPQSGFYKDDFAALQQNLIALEKNGAKTLLLGVSFALLDFVAYSPMFLQNTIVMETGGMKGRRKELVRADLHAQLKKGFGVAHIHSEYGMTELLSQAYSKRNGIFTTPNWMQVLPRDMDDPLQAADFNQTAGINIIDLANARSCSFIATQDLGKCYSDGSFEVLGRFDQSDVRGCNLLAI